MNLPQRLDVTLVARQLVASRTRAAELIRAGQVRVGGQRVTKPSTAVAAQDDVTVDTTDHYVSRAGHKLEGFLTDLGTSAPEITEARCLDIGASTGGFTQVLLDNGAQHVVALDVGHDQLAEQLRIDARVTSIEGSNARFLTADSLPWRPDLVVADVSFISLTMLLGPISRLLSAGGGALVLVKPQFEVGKEALGASGVVRDPQLRERAVLKVIRAGLDAGLRAHAVQVSRLPGPHGNLEYFVQFEAVATDTDADALRTNPIPPAILSQVAHAIYESSTKVGVA